MDTENISLNLNLNKISYNLTRSILLLVLYEMIGFILFYLYKKYKYQKIKELSNKLNKPLIIIKCMKDYIKLKELQNNSSCILVNNFFEHTDPKYDIEYRKEITRVGGDNVLHIYRPFFLLLSYLRSDRVFYQVNNNSETFMISNTLLTKVFIILIFMTIMYMIGNYTIIKDSINSLLSYFIDNTDLKNNKFLNNLKKDMNNNQGYLLNKDTNLINQKLIINNDTKF